jgi:uncharacterized OsmC-like protein
VKVADGRRGQADPRDPQGLQGLQNPRDPQDYTGRPRTVGMASPSEQMEANDDQWVQIGRSGDDEVATANVRDEHELPIDEPPWLDIGNDTAPWPSDYLLVACAGCQVEVITQALEKARVDDYDIDVHATFETEQVGPELEEYPDHLTWHYRTIVLEIAVETTEDNRAKMERLLEVAEDACIVSRSVEHGIEFEITKELSVSADGPQ